MLVIVVRYVRQLGHVVSKVRSGTSLGSRNPRLPRGPQSKAAKTHRLTLPTWRSQSNGLR